MNEKIDLLNRSFFVEKVINLINKLSDNKKGCCFAIEGAWGIGKTFVIEKLEEELRGYQSEDNGDDRYFVFHYNCWKYDYYEEPAIAIISAMLDSVEEDDAVGCGDFGKKVRAGYSIVRDELKKIAGLYIKKKIGVNVISLFDNIEKVQKDQEDEEYEFNEMYDFSQTIDKVRSGLKNIAKNRTIVIVVDELDRCIPAYTIKVLERIHHIFYGIGNIIVIMAIDRRQLEHSVEEMFGARMNGETIDIEKYLKKFIDYSIKLDNGVVNKNFIDKYAFYTQKFNLQNELEESVELINILPKLLEGIDIRSQEKLIEKANIVHSIVCNSCPQKDISVMFFEILYGVLQLLKFGDMSIVAKINHDTNEELEKIIGEKKVKFLIYIVENGVTEKKKNNGAEILKHNLYGKILWYFANIFNENSMPVCFEEDFNRTDDYKSYDNNIKMLKEYCDFCEIIK